ncbi:hypothetical protein THAR02_04399 [Trichoderma harzianum]|uniref:AB hydrolase-1 domain-containing protein n=1 Tax=Trichoderma harzianum TaxID=5544 RepID=A0A0G0AEM4_TRIHA|nr:hypothetical protein THAR02_04399 [Trichoderma harzianum]
MANLATGIHKLQGPHIELTYTVRGSGPYLIIQAAGWGISSQYLQIGLSPLEAQFTLIYMEPRGSGPSERPQEDMMSTSDMTDDLELLRKHLEFEQINLLVRNLILLTHWPEGYDDSRTWQRFLDERKGNPAFSKALAALEIAETQKFRSQDQWFQNLRVRLSFYPANPDKDYYPAFEKAMGEPSWWVYKAQGAADKIKTLDLYAGLDKVKARTLCLGCSEDPICTENVTRITAEHIAGSQLIIIPECRHFPWIEQPDQFFEAVIEFLR